ncbi:MAG: L-threonylcarbamoyladenylate synthase [Bacteroidota bacterium]
MKSSITKNIALCQNLLRDGNLVAIPTETVYGLAANIYDDTAVKKIFKMKRRPLYNPLIVHIHHIDQLPTLAKDIPHAAQELASHFWPGPLTMILPKQGVVSDLVTAGRSTVGIRMPDHPLTLTMLEGLDFPIAAPSANPFTRVSPTSAQHVADYFGNRVGAILDGGASQVGLESTIIGFEGGVPVIYRKGGIAIEAIEACTGVVKLALKSEKAPIAPGMLAKHYAPKTKLILTDDVEKVLAIWSARRIGVLSFYRKVYPKAALVKVLSEKRDLDEAAAHLFDALHQLDAANVDVIIAERLPEQGLGMSINDRLERAEN